MRILIDLTETERAAIRDRTFHRRFESGGGHQQQSRDWPSANSERARARARRFPGGAQS